MDRQDPAVINETGLCVWRSGSKPVLDFKRNGDMLSGLMALLWTGQPHDTPAGIDFVPLACFYFILLMKTKKLFQQIEIIQ